jgi:hypothetical protein
LHERAREGESIEPPPRISSENRPRFRFFLKKLEGAAIGKPGERF